MLASGEECDKDPKNTKMRPMMVNLKCLHSPTVLGIKTNLRLSMRRRQRCRPMSTCRYISSTSIQSSRCIRPPRTRLPLTCTNDKTLVELRFGLWVVCMYFWRIFVRRWLCPQPNRAHDTSALYLQRTCLWTFLVSEDLLIWVFCKMMTTKKRCSTVQRYDKNIGCACSTKQDVMPRGSERIFLHKFVFQIRHVFFTRISKQTR